MVVAPQALGTSGVGVANAPVIVAVWRIVAPSIGYAQRPQRQTATRPRQAIGAIKHLAEHEGSDRRGTIPLSFVSAAARPAERAGKAQVST
jgi:hypothetical protein